MTKTLSIIFGIILALLGVLGFTNNSLIGANSYFVADTMHNFIHIVLGGALLIIAFRMNENHAFWLKVIGVITFLLGLIGVLTVPSIGGSLFGIAATNGASDWFHLIFGAVIFAGGMYGKDDMISRP